MYTHARPDVAATLTLRQCDPESSHSILSHPVLAPKTTLITLDLTHLVLATSDIQARLLDQEGGARASDLRQMLHDLLSFFAHTYDSVFGISAGPPLHDPLAVAVLLETLTEKSEEGHRFDYGEAERYVVGVVTDGRHAGEHQDGGGGTVGPEAEVGQVGRTIVEVSTGDKGVRIPKNVQLDWFWDEILAAVDRAETAVKGQVSAAM
jgi:uridine nucleosidase